MYKNVAGRQELDRLSTQMRKIVSAADARGTNTLNSAEREKWNRLKAAYEKKEREVCASEGIASLDDTRGRVTPSDMGDLSGMPDARALRAMRPHARRAAMQQPEERAFTNWLRRGINGLDSEDRDLMRNQFRDANSLGIQNAQGTGTGAAGGYIVPQGFSDQLMEAMLWFGGIDGVVGQFETETGQPFPWPTINDTTNKGRIIGQNIQVTETDFTFSEVTFNAYILSSDLVLIPLSLMEDSFFDLGALCARLLGTRLGRLLNNMGTVGTGTAEPTGIVTAALAAGLAQALSSATTVDYADLVNMEHAVDPAYRGPSARWMFHDQMLKNLKLLVDGNNRPLWQPGLTASFADGAAVVGSGKPTILGYPYVINNDMPTPAASANSMLFGDMSCFKLRKVGDITLIQLRERYADYLQTGLIAYLRADTNLIDAGTHPIVVGQQAA
jgi:HK97 family phage major capsid protein